MFADLTYYLGTFKGTKVKNIGDYEYLGREASRHISKVTTEINEDTKDCECALVEYLFDYKRQGNIASESIPNAYSVSYKSANSNYLAEISEIIAFYLGDKYSAVGIVDLI